VRIDLSCAACGSNRILFNHAVSDACEVTCAECGGRIGTFGELKQRVTEQLARPAD
jgi:ribosomal protein S27E